MRVRWLAESEFAAARAPWNRLLAAAPVDHVFLTWEWQYTWWDGFRAGRELRLLLAYDGDEWLGIWPLVRRRLGLGRHWRRLEPLASGEREAEEICTEYLAPIVRPDRADEVWPAWMATLAAGARGEEPSLAWDDLLLTRCRPGEWLESLRRYRPKGWIVSPGPEQGCPYVALPTSFAAYLAMLSANTRQQIRRLLRELDRHRWTLEEADDFAAAEAILADLCRLHQRRWRSRGRPGAFGSERFRRFPAAAVPRLLERGWLSLLRLRVDGETVGCLYNLRYRGAVAFYQCGLDLERFGALRPGILLHTLAIRQAIERGDREYDFLGGVSRYKASLAPTSRPLASLRIARRGLRAALFRAEERLHQGGRAVLRRLRRGQTTPSTS